MSSLIPKWLLPILLLLSVSWPALGQPVFENARPALGGGTDRLIDQDGNTVLVSFFYDSLDVDLDGTIDLYSRGGSDLLIRSDAPDGTLNWVRTAGSNVESRVGAFGIQPTEETRNVAQDAQGNLYMAGQFYGTIDFDQDQVLDIVAPEPDTSAMFVAKYSKDGTFQWATAYGGNNHRLGEIAYDPNSGNLLMASVRFNYNNTGEREESDMILVELSTEGAYLREKTIPLAELAPPWQNFHLTPFPTHLQFDASNNIYIFGRFWGPTNHQSSFFVAKYNAQLDMQWVRQSRNQTRQSDTFFVDDQEHAWVSGSYGSTPIAGFEFMLSDPDTTYIAPNPTQYVTPPPGFFVARYTPEGAIGCVRFFPNTESLGNSSPNAIPLFIHQPFTSSVITGIVTGGEFDLDEDGIIDLHSSLNYLTLMMSLSGDCSLNWTWHSVRNVSGAVLKGPGSTYRFEGSFTGQQLYLDGLEDESPLLNDIPNTPARFAVDVTFTDPALPVELVDFSVLQNQGNVTLSWQTASELNNTGFEIQQSTAGASWQPITFIDGAGTTNESQHYSHTLTALPPGTYQFRLKQIDFDGTFAYSDVQSIQIGLDGNFLLSEAYPNPFNPQATFTLSLAREQEVRITLYDMTGRQVAQLHKGPLAANTTHTFTIDGSQLPSGMYVYSVKSSHFMTSKKVMLVK